MPSAAKNRAACEGKNKKASQHSKNSLHDNGRFLRIPLSKIQPNDEQPRTHFDEEKLNELAQSIKDKGILQPIIVRPTLDNQRYLLLAGDRRFRAAKIAGLRDIPAVIKKDEDPLEIALIENLQREDLNPIELAEGLQKLKEQNKYSDADIGRILGISRTRANEILALTRLPDAIKQECRHVDSVPKTLLCQIVRMGNLEQILEAWEQYKSGNLSIIQARQQKNSKPKKTNKQNEYVREPKDEKYKLIIRFRRRSFSEEDVLNVLNKELEYIMRLSQ